MPRFRRIARLSSRFGHKTSAKSRREGTFAPGKSEGDGKWWPRNVKSGANEARLSTGPRSPPPACPFLPLNATFRFTPRFSLGGPEEKIAWFSPSMVAATAGTVWLMRFRLRL